MLSLMSVMSIYPALCNLIVAHCCEVMYIRCLDFRDELSFLNCDDVYMCVVNNQCLSSSSLFLSPFMLTCSMMRFLSLLPVCLCGVCSPVVVVGLYVRLSWYPMLWMR